jgi:hypothetical protein
VSCAIPPATPEINQHSLLGRLTHQKIPKKTEQKPANCILAHSTAEGAGSLKVHQAKGEGQGTDLHELSVNKCWKGRKARNSQVISHSLKEDRWLITKIIS